MKRRIRKIAYVGIDPGIEPTLSVRIGPLVNSYKVENKPLPWKADKRQKWEIEMTRLLRLSTGLIAILYDILPYEKYVVVAGVEGLAYARKFNVALMSKIEYVILDTMQALPNSKILYRPTPQQVKKYVTGKGNADKARVMEAVAEVFPNKVLKDHNVSDSLAVMMYTEHLYRIGETP